MLLLMELFCLRQLRVFHLIEAEVTYDKADWISRFPESGTCLESLIIYCVKCPINFDALENLVARSPSLKKLRVNRFVTLEQLYRVMIRALQLTHLGTGSFSPSENTCDQGPDLVSAFAACRLLVCLSGFREIVPDYLPAVYYVLSANITSLDFSYANITAANLNQS
uniref:FBD domain-containing protein n=1 Tax=Daucus carota subsp. sativus TaxID=79200 RepID=A0A166I460_DAUCS